jgi:hypothetical protein
MCTTQLLVENIEGVSSPAVLCDVSASGARLRCPLAIPLDARVWVRIATSKRRRTSEPVLAQVVRTTEDGFAIEWLDFSPNAVRVLLSLEEIDQVWPAQARTRASLHL